MIKIGVLALQGDYLEHQRILQILGINSTYIKTPDQLNKIDGLIVPGGESTTINKLMNSYNIKAPLKKLVRRGMPIWGTCAGMIIIANKIVQSTPKPLSLIDITVDRNAFGNQTESFEQLITFSKIGKQPFRSIFIRAPQIIDIGETIDVLGRLPNKQPVAVKQNNILATSFHPELTNDYRIHEFFVNMI